MRIASEWLKVPENRQLVQDALRRREIETDAGLQVICEFDADAMAIALDRYAGLFTGIDTGGVVAYEVTAVKL